MSSFLSSTLHFSVGLAFSSLFLSSTACLPPNGPDLAVTALSGGHLENGRFYQSASDPMLVLRVENKGNEAATGFHVTNPSPLFQIAHEAQAGLSACSSSIDAKTSCSLVVRALADQWTSISKLRFAHSSGENVFTLEGASDARKLAGNLYRATELNYSNPGISGNTGDVVALSGDHFLMRASKYSNNVYTYPYLSVTPGSPPVELNSPMMSTRGFFAQESLVDGFIYGLGYETSINSTSVRMYKFNANAEINQDYYGKNESEQIPFPNGITSFSPLNRVENLDGRVYKGFQHSGGCLIMKLNPNGTLDGFLPNLSLGACRLGPVRTEGIYVMATAGTEHGLYRLTPDGAVDPTFGSGGVVLPSTLATGPNAVWAAEATADGLILELVGGTGGAKVVKIDYSGNLVEVLATLPFWPKFFKVSSSGQIYYGGDFGSNPNFRIRIGRLNANGTPDTAFHAPHGYLDLHNTNYPQTISTDISWIGTKIFVTGVAPSATPGITFYEIQ
mgnify:CR=1 FL=1